MCDRIWDRVGSTPVTGVVFPSRLLRAAEFAHRFGYVCRMPLLGGRTSFSVILTASTVTYEGGKSVSLFQGKSAQVSAREVECFHSTGLSRVLFSNLLSRVHPQGLVLPRMAQFLHSAFEPEKTFLSASVLHCSLHSVARNLVAWLHLGVT